MTTQQVLDPSLDRPRRKYKRRVDWYGPRERFTVRLTSEFAERVKADATTAGLTISEYIAKLLGDDHQAPIGGRP
jgi:predicted DNA binding CopG/RHH family protein